MREMTGILNCSKTAFSYTFLRFLQQFSNVSRPENNQIILSTPLYTSLLRLRTLNTFSVSTECRQGSSQLYAQSVSEHAQQFLQ